MSISAAIYSMISAPLGDSLRGLYLETSEQSVISVWHCEYFGLVMEYKWTASGKTPGTLFPKVVNIVWC